MTFSIVACDPEQRKIVSAVTIRWSCVGPCVQFFWSGIGMNNMQNFYPIDLRIDDDLDAVKKLGKFYDAFRTREILNGCL